MGNKLKAVGSTWYIWLFPFFAAVISGWLLFDHYRQTGTLIRVYFDDATGIQIEQTQVRFRGIPIGLVKEVYLSDDRRDVIAKILLKKSASEFAVEGSKFSLVVPKVSFQGVSGLDTFIEGTYIAALPGPRQAAEKVDFKVSSSTALTDTLDDTSSYTLETGNAESLSIRDAVTFRGIKVGSVTKLTLSKDAQTVHVQINIENRFTKLIHTNTVFWPKVGVQAKLGLFHSEIKVNSMDSIMNGGIEFATPNEAGPVAKANQKFILTVAAPKDYEKWNPKQE